MNSKIDQLYPKKAKQSAKQKTASKEKDDKMLRAARERSRDGSTYWRDNWDNAEADLTFLSGKQWPDKVKSQREADKRPCLTNNVLPTFVDQIVGDQRQNRPVIKVSAVDAAHVKTQEGTEEELKIANRAGSKDYPLSEVFNGIIKNIEYSCDAETSYDFAFQAAVEGGFGYLRVLTDYASDEGFEQEILIKHVDNQFAVIIDPGAKEPDCSDMNWCFIDDEMLKEDFKEKYPDVRAEPVSDDIDDMGTWYSEKTVKVCEYFTREAVIREVALLSDGRTVYLDEIEPIIDELMEKGISIERTRKVKTYKVYWRKITGYDVLEGPIELNCTTIPVVPVWGKKLTIKKKVIYRSVIRHSKDAQRMSNYWDSAATESVALAPKAPFVGSEAQIEGYESQWEEANTTNLSILTYVAQSANDPGPQRSQPAAIPAAEISLGMQSTDKIKSTMGMFDASRGAQGNETSGKAIRERKTQAHVGNFAFIDNLSKAIRRVGKLLVELIPQVYDTERIMRLKFEDETEDYVLLNQQIYDDESGEYVTINDLGVAKYDVIVKTGPAYATQRQEAAESMIQFASAVPAAAAVMADLIANNMDWPGASDLAERLRKIVPPNVLSNKEREEIQKDMPEQQPTPEQQLQMQELEVRKVEAEAKGMKASADIEQAKQDTLQEELQTEQARLKLQQIDQGAKEGNVDLQAVKELISEALAELLPKAVKK